LDEEAVTKWDLLYIKQKQLNPVAYAMALLLDDQSILILGGR
jgi:hypothetical protein